LARQGVHSLVTENSIVIATSNPALEGATVTMTRDGATRIENDGVMILLKEPSIRSPFGGERDQTRVFLLPSETDHLEITVDSEAGLLRPIQRWIIVVIALGALAGIALAFGLARRVTGPLEELTRAVRKMESGDLTVRVAVSTRDEVAALGEAFNALATRLESVEHLRQEMVSDIAHELRGPITSMRCEIESVQDGVRPLDYERIDQLHRETLALGRLVDDLQELALADAGQLRLEFIRFDLMRAVSRLADGIRASASERKVRIEVQGQAGEVIADERRLLQVVRNLLINAIAHAPEDSVVSVSASRRSGFARVEITDHGPGIPIEERERIFDRFHRLDPSRSRATGGTGLGLTIAKTIVDAHGGSIGLTDTAGGGATFWFTLPTEVSTSSA
ncbi:MAG: sensor histidine kinase, partial [Thermoanaerobaculia bacterium]